MSDRDGLEVEALVTDKYLDSLLNARERRPTPAQQATASGANTDEAVFAAARALGADLARVHPSFRFEERLAADLQLVATRQPRGARPGRMAALRRLEQRPASAAARAGAAGRSNAGPRPAMPGTPAMHGPQMTRPLLIGGALTSAALSIAGAYVAWRRGRPPVDPMVRAVRAAHRTGFARRIPARASRLAFSRGTRSR